MGVSDIAAWWGAVIATLVLGWDIFKWKQSGYKLRLSLRPEMQLIGDDSGRLYVVIEVVNIGDKTTELTHVAGSLYKSHLQRYSGKNERSFIVPKPSLFTEFPYYLEPGKRWMGG